MRQFVLILATVFLLTGCAATKAAVEDYKTGATVPLETGEISPRESVQPIVESISGIPIIGGYAPIIGALLAAIATWRRGRRIRKGKPTSENPITGWVGSKAGLETIVQSLANIVTGIFEVGKDGSWVKRAWKVGLSTVLSIGTAAVTIPAVRDAIAGNPSIVIAVSGLAAVLGGLEKAFSSVLPVEKEGPVNA